MGKMEHFSEPVADARTLRLSHAAIELPVRGHASRRSTFYTVVGKRILDLLFVVAMLPVAVPLILGAALLVMRDGASPFFGHRRVGRDGKSFYCWKIRSMVPDAAERLQAHLAANPAARAEWDATFKLNEDPRITRFGRFLRSSSLDELPQLWNIVKGEMSVVGPRPVTRTELAQYGQAVRDYSALRPGLTGMWQVSGRNDISYADRVALDVYYTRNLTLLMDLRIIFGTVGVVLKRTGR